MLKVSVDKLGQIAILQVRGHMVIGTEIEVLRQSVLSQSQVGSVILDLTRVTRIDARGLALLLELREQLQTRSIEFRLMNVPKLIQQVLKITCLDSVFQIASEEDLALDFIGAMAGGSA